MLGLICYFQSNFECIKIKSFSGWFSNRESIIILVNPFLVGWLIHLYCPKKKHKPLILLKKTEENIVAWCSDSEGRWFPFFTGFWLIYTPFTSKFNMGLKQMVEIFRDNFEIEDLERERDHRARIWRHNSEERSGQSRISKGSINLYWIFS